MNKNTKVYWNDKELKVVRNRKGQFKNEGSRQSVDVGVMQINTMYWGKKATELGLNLMIEADNRKMAEYIFNNFGTDAWSSSKRCWSK